MVATIQQIIGKINPLLYASNGKELLKKYGSSDKIPAEEVTPQAVRYFVKGSTVKIEKGGMEASHTLAYDSTSETLEPIYFFILDLMNDFGLAPEKLIDNFASSPGSGHFAELGQRATIMQQQASKLMGDVNTVLRSVLNIIYDLKEFRIRLQVYDDFKSKDKDKSQGAMLSLKQLWMDKVDIIKGNSSIKAMALTQAGFTTLIDAFLVANDEKDIAKLDLNDRAKRILLPRIHEFNLWLQQSEQELRKRYELEKTYLRSQVSSLKIYSRWAKPYLRVAQELESKVGGRNAALVKIFNTLLLELSLLGKTKIDVRSSAAEGKLPKELEKIKTKRDYYSCILVDFVFRGIPQRMGQQSHYTFGGRTEVSFRAYALNDDELKKLNEELEKSDMNDMLTLIEGATTESLEQMQDEINFFLEEKEEKASESAKDTSNPFLALIGRYDKTEKKEPEKSKEKKSTTIEKDSWVEKTQIRPFAAQTAAESAFNIFDVYKKAHGMPSYTPGYP